ncbi:MAG: outer membrane lipoprotein LolB [Flavobacteriales bacterium]|jgi:outer membrane lipoprotein LolB
MTRAIERSRYIALLALLVITSCSTFTAKNTNINESYWTAEGKLAFKHEGKSQKANIRWQQQGGDYDILLFGPLGKGKIAITKHDKTITLNDGNQLHHSANAEELLYRVSGLELPISYAQHWITGAPSPNTTHTMLAEPSADFEQAGWKVSYLRFTNDEAHRLPTKIIISNDAQRLTIIIKRWSYANKEPQ